MKGAKVCSPKRGQKMWWPSLFYARNLALEYENQSEQWSRKTDSFANKIQQSVQGWGLIAWVFLKRGQLGLWGLKMSFFFFICSLELGTGMWRLARADERLVHSLFAGNKWEFAHVFIIPLRLIGKELQHIICFLDIFVLTESTPTRVWQCYSSPAKPQVGNSCSTIFTSLWHNAANNQTLISCTHNRFKRFYWTHFLASIILCF